MPKSLYLSACFCFIFILKSQASTLSGSIKDKSGQPLPFASIFVKNTNIGSTSNAEGNYAIELMPGTYELIFRYLGYESQILSVKIESVDIKRDIVLSQATINLAEAVVGKQKEDPALTIMRKTIAMSSFHYKELLSYSYKSYIRGNAEIKDIPFFAKKQMEKEFIKIGQLYVFESVSEAKFKQPNTFSQKLLGSKSNLPPNLKSSVVSMNVGKFNIYNPLNGDSPVTKKGARNYRYEYLGYFLDNETVVNKIKVIPKTNADGLYSGIINIVDNSWYIHSSDLKYTETGTETSNKIIYEITDGVWIPNNINATVNFDYLGIAVRFKFVATIKDLKITKDPKYARVKPEIIDEKLFDEKPTAEEKKKSTLKKVNLKDLYSLKQELQKEEKEELKKQDLDKISQNRSYAKDSLAEKRGVDFWAAEQQIPYTPEEIIGFKKGDSLVAANIDKINKKISKDSIDALKSKKFKFNNIIFGKTINRVLLIDTIPKLYKHKTIIGGLAKNIRFTAVEGYRIGMSSIDYYKYKSRDVYRGFNFKPYFTIGHQNFYGEFGIIENREKAYFSLSAGKTVTQVNNNEPISDLINSAYALLGNQHYAKFYNKNYVKFKVGTNNTVNWSINSSLEYIQRNLMENIAEQGYFQNDRYFEPNNIISPLNKSARSNTITKWETSLSYRPKASISYYNNKASIINTASPIVTLKHTLGIGSGVFGQLDLVAKKEFTLRGLQLNTKLNAGTFYNGKNMNFVDFKHFLGNEVFVFTNPESFRDLSYYMNSTHKSYLQTFVKASPNKFILSQIPFLKRKGFSEYMFQNFLLTQNISHAEVGYGLSFLKILNVEVFSSFSNNKYNKTDFRLQLNFK